MSSAAALSHPRTVKTGGKALTGHLHSDMIALLRYAALNVKTEASLHALPESYANVRARMPPGAHPGSAIHRDGGQAQGSQRPVSSGPGDWIRGGLK